METFWKVVMVFVQWGLGFSACFLTFILIGLAVLECLDMKTIRKISKYLHN